MNAVFAPGPVELLLLIVLGGGFGLPSGVPPLEEDPVMARVAPAECAFYTTWAGTGIPSATSSNQTEQLLAEPEIQKFVQRSRNMFLSAMRGPMATRPQAQRNFEAMNKLLQLVQGKPGALFISELRFRGNEPPELIGGAVLRVDKDGAELKALLEDLQSRATKESVSSVPVADQTFSRIELDKDFPPVTWGVRGNYLFIGLGEGSAEETVQRSNGEPPGWLKEVRARLAIPRPSSFMHLNVNRLVQVAVASSDALDRERMLRTFGLDTIQSFATVSGLDDKGWTIRSLLAVDGPGRGLLSWIDAKPLAADDLKIIGRDALVAAALKLSLSQVLEIWLDLAGHIDRNIALQTMQGIAMFEQQAGVSIRDDLLNSIGDTWRIFAKPGPGGVLTGWTLAVPVRDRQRLERFQNALVGMAKTAIDQAGAGAPSIESSTVNGFTVHTFSFSQPGIPISPSWCVTDRELFVTLTPQALHPLLSGASDTPSLAELPDVKALLDGDSHTLAFAYVDTHQVASMLLPMAQAALQSAATRPGFLLPVPLDPSIFPPAGAILPHLQPTRAALRRTADGVELVSHQTIPGPNLAASAPVAVALLLPAGSAAREAARRTQAANQLKQIGLSLHNFHDIYRAFPAGYSAGGDGKPLLSWRVHILPFLEQEDLYKQFHLDEPWNSPHNKELIARMPEVFRSPNSTAEPGKTNYLGVSGTDGVFVRPKPDNKMGTTFRQITDGTSNTIMTVEVPDAASVIWTKPGDFAPNKEEPTRGLFGLRRGGCNAGFADGSVRFIAESIDARVLKAFFTKSGGEVVEEEVVGGPALAD